jgi:hypothetical protein
MKKAVATEESLRRRLDEFEKEFGLVSADFYRLHELGDAPENIPPFSELFGLIPVAAGGKRPLGIGPRC